MKNLILFNINLLKRQKSTLIVLFFFTISFIAIALGSTEQPNPQLNYSKLDLFILDLNFGFKIYWVFTCIILPFLLINIFYTNNPLNNHYSYLSFLPISKQAVFQSYLVLILFILGSLGITISIISGIKSNNFNIDYVYDLIKWTFGLIIISFFYYNILLIFSYWFKSKFVLLFFHIASIFLCRFNNFFWIPINWPKIYIQYLEPNSEKQYFFKVNPPENLLLVAIMSVFVLNILLFYKGYEKGKFL